MQRVDKDDGPAESTSGKPEGSGYFLLSWDLTTCLTIGMLKLE